CRRPRRSRILTHVVRVLSCPLLLPAVHHLGDRLMSTAGNETVDLAPIAEGSPGMFDSTTQSVEVVCGAASHTGKVRENNEDHYARVRATRSREILLTNVDTTDVHLPDDHAHTLIVADGVGGRGFGELASEFVLRFGWELAGQATSWLMKFEPT